jgi:type III secretion protein V
MKTDSMLTSLLTKVAARTELAAAVLVVAIVVVMVLPIPVFVLDILIALNLAVSALLVVLAIYLPGPLAFSSFPSVLLLTTLFRLAISVATTRQILLSGDGGHIVETFGQFVAGGNLVVGMVVFLIITIVNFLVVTKGCERVAEVAARFSLDGMPGKQMSIDSDLRAGLIDQNEARRRRSVLEKESQLFGAMDGAMKFVKGDAIAGLIIIFVNLLGGLTIGTLQHDMTASAAAKLYCILSIGDGLIAQIPALLISVAAGMIITRVVQSDDKTTNIGRDIVEQVTAQPKALLISGGLMLVFATVPGMPTSTLVVLGGLLMAGGLLKLRAAMKGEGDEIAEGDGDALGTSYSDLDAPKFGDEQELDDLSGFSAFNPLVLEISDALVAEQRTLLVNAVRDARNRLVTKLGAPIPPLSIRVNPASSAERLQLLINQVPMLLHQVREGQICIRESASNLENLGIEIDVEPDRTTGFQRVWASEADAERLSECGIGYWDNASVLSQQAEDVLRRNVQSFVGIQECAEILQEVEKGQPELVKEFNRVVPLSRFAEVLQRLLSEGVSVRNIKIILQSLIDWGQRERDVVTLTEHVRVALRQQISYQFSQQGVLNVLLLDDELEDLVRSSIRQSAMGSFLALDPETTQNVVDRIREVVADPAPTAGFPVILTPVDLRRYVRKMVETDLFRLPVLSFNEIIPELSVQPLTRISLQL